MSDDSVWIDKRMLDRDMRTKQKELMDEYMDTVYYPKLKAIQERCLQQNGTHAETTWHDNGLGWGWWYCGRCGISHGKVKL